MFNFFSSNHKLEVIHKIALFALRFALMNYAVKTFCVCILTLVLINKKN